MPITYAFLSSNERKCTEYAAQLSKYARALRILPYSEVESERLQQIETDLRAAEEKDRFVLRETSDLFVASDWDRGVETVSSKNTQDEPVYHVSKLTVYTLDETGAIKQKTYSAQVAGHVDLSRRSEDSHTDALAWWDDIFVTERSGASYDQELDLWGKCSARQQVIGQFVCDNLLFKRLRDITYKPHNPKQAVEFDHAVSGRSTLRNNEFVSMARLDRCPWGLGNLLTHIVNAGVFLRSADSNRSGNYFLPPLSGIPRHKKPDPFWETTYQIHDFFHQAVPDQLFSGPVDSEHRNVYVAARLMSEGLTIVLADMLFVEAIKASGFEYDFSTRKINPLFDSLTLPEGTRREQLKTLLQANVAFANLGDEAPYLAILKPGSDAALQAYTETYKHFFVPDLLWSIGNYDDMAARHADFAAWNELVGTDLFARARLPLLHDLVCKLKASGADLTTYESSVGPVFEHLFETVLAPQLQAVEPVSDQEAQSNAFRRYMIGQSFLYAVYRSVKGISERARRLLDNLRQPDVYTQDDIHRIRAVYQDDLVWLQRRHLITGDDQKLFAQIFPLLSPRFLSYDFGKTAFQSVPEAIRATLHTGV